MDHYGSDVQKCLNSNRLDLIFPIPRKMGNKNSHEHQHAHHNHQQPTEAGGGLPASSVLSGAEVKLVEEFCGGRAAAVGAKLRTALPGSVVEALGVEEGWKMTDLLAAFERAASDSWAKSVSCHIMLEAFAGTLAGGQGESSLTEEECRLANSESAGPDLSVFQLLLVICCGREKHSVLQSATIGSRVELWKLSRWMQLDSRAVLTPLYSSRTCGDGVGAFARTLTCYTSPSILLVRSAAGDVVGVYTDVEWKPASQFFGGGSTKLFTVHPEKKLFATTGISHNYLYLHIPSSKVTTKGVIPDGVAVGGQMEGFRFHLDADFKHGEASTFDSTFENGLLLPLAAKQAPAGMSDLFTFDIAEVEVLGLGGNKAIADQDIKKQQEIKEAMKRRQVNKKIMLGGDDDADVDMWLLETAGAHQSYVKDADHVS